MVIDMEKSIKAVRDADIAIRIQDDDEIRVLQQLIEDRWIIMWCDMKEKEAADRLVKRNLVRVMGHDSEGPPGRYELWPIIRKRIIRSGATAVFLENCDFSLNGKE